MALSFLSDSLKTTIKNAYASFHQSFVRPITAFQIGQRVALSSSSDYNAFYRQSYSTEEEFLELSDTFYARIRYVKMDEEFFTESDGSSMTSNTSKIILPAGSVELKVDAIGYNYIKDSKRIEFDNKRFAIKHNPRPIGFFDGATDYWEFLLIPTDE